MEKELLELKIQIVELKTTISELLNRVESLEKKETGSGIFIEGVAEGYRDFIKKELGGK